eukprot:jgi/Botrbrau1/2457/Bobra.0226s0016.1
MPLATMRNGYPTLAFHCLALLYISYCTAAAAPGPYRLLLAGGRSPSELGQGGQAEQLQMGVEVLQDVADSPEGSAPKGPAEEVPQKGHQTRSGTSMAPGKKQGLGDPVVVAREPRRAPPGGLKGDHGGPAGAAHGQGTVGDLRACGRVPHVDLDWLLSNDSLAYGMHGCKVYRRVCLDQGAFVMYDEKYLPKNGSSPQMPVFGPLPPQAVAQWRGNARLRNVSAFMGPSREYPNIRFRPPLAGDPGEPAFSECTLPLIFIKSHEENFYHGTVSLVPQLYSWHQLGKVSADVTYVMNTLDGQAVPPYIHPILAPFTQYEVQSLADFSSRLPADFPSNATAEGRHIRCFEMLILCYIWDMAEYGTQMCDLPQAGESVYGWHRERGSLPRNPAGFQLGVGVDERAERSGKIKILIEAREGLFRNLMNMEELVSACNGDPEGTWECRGYHMGTGVERDMEAVRTSDVFVAVHGAATANMIFMREGTALLEVLPYGFTRYSQGWWPNVFNPTTAMRMGFRVRYYGINIEDPQLSQPSRFEAEGTWAFGHSPTRDRHVNLPWPALRHVLELVRETRTLDAYLKLQMNGDNVLDLRPGGVLSRTTPFLDMQGAGLAHDVAPQVQEAREMMNKVQEMLARRPVDMTDAAYHLDQALWKAGRVLNMTRGVLSALGRPVTSGRQRATLPSSDC